MKSPAADEQATKFALSPARDEPNRTWSRSPSRYSRIKLVNFSKVGKNSVASVWVVPLGQTSGYLDPKSQEALHEVDVSGVALHFSFGERPEGEAIGSLG